MAAAIHAGHDVRPVVRSALALDEATRLREEDPYTDTIAACAKFRVEVFRSRFEVDLNRSRDRAIYREPDDAWGLSVWRRKLSHATVQRSLEIYDAFYADLAAHLDRISDSGPFVLLDIHSYNYRREGAGKKVSDPANNPDINVGTGSMGARWRTVTDALIDALSQTHVNGQSLDVRENVRFEGANLARWVHGRYPTTGCVPALEYKKTFMDEWTGNVDREHLNQLQEALKDVLPYVHEALNRAA